MMRWCCGFLLLTVLGCTSDDTQTGEGKPFAGQSVSLLVIDNPSFAEAITRLRTAWQDRTGAVLEITAVETLPAKLSGYDVFVFPSPQLGILVDQNVLSPLAADRLENRQLAWSEVFESLRRGEARYGEQVFAVPLGSTSFMLMANAGLVKEDSLPETWEELITRTQTLPRDVEAIAMPLGDGWASLCYLAIAAPHAKRMGNYSALFDPETMRPQLNSPPFLRALEHLNTLYQAGSPEQLSYSPQNVQHEFLSGNVAMAIGWPLGTEAQEEQSISTRFAPLPGSREVYFTDRKSWEVRRNESPQVPLLNVQGTLGGIAAQSQHPQAAWQLLLDLAKSEWSDSVRKQTVYALPSRPRHLTQLPAGFSNALSEYRTAVQSTFSAQQHLDALRIPGRTRYLAALEAEIRQTLQGNQTPSAALEAATDAWERITNELGRSQQQAAYRRSIGMDF